VTRPSDLGTAALEYAERDWPVFPLVPRGKPPLTKRGFQDATTDLDIVRAWWSATPDANIGLATGSTFDVLDVDGDSGVQSLRAFWTARDISYHHAGPVSLTGRGWHFFFAATGRSNGARLLGEESKLDFRGTGGYVVAPPSVHPLGHQYRWDPNRDIDSPLPEAPDWLFQLLDRDDNPRRDSKVIIRDSGPGITYEDLIAGGLIPLDQAPRATRVAREDILEVCADLNIRLRRGGDYYMARCPFPDHNDSDPSFAVYPKNNTFFCHGCRKYGDSADLRRMTFIQK